MYTLLLADFTSVAKSILYVLLAILILLIMITVHEFGHYIVGKIFKFKIDEFAIGFGPAIYKKTKKNGEVFSIRLLPLGGFCAFAGEDDLEEEKKKNKEPFEEETLSQDNDKDYKLKHQNDFVNKPPWQRILVLVFGAFMNLLLALVVSAVFLGVYGCPAYQVSSFTDSQGTYHAVLAPFEEDDVIVSINGKNIYMVTDIMDAIDNKEVGDTVVVEVLRDGRRVDLSIVIGSYEIENIESVGETLSNIGVPALYKTSVRFGFFNMLGRVFEYTFKIGLSVLMVLGQLVTGKLGVSAMGGTVTTIAQTAQGIQNYGVEYLLQITSLIGVNLAIFNLLPLPALDGSKVVFTAIEWVRGKPINRRVESIIHFVGIILLFAFAILVDLQHCF